MKTELKFSASLLAIFDVDSPAPEVKVRQPKPKLGLQEQAEAMNDLEKGHICWVIRYNGKTAHMTEFQDKCMIYDLHAPCCHGRKEGARERGIKKRKATTVVNIHNAKFDVYIGRAGKGQDGYFGNPFRITNESDRTSVLAAYEHWFYRRMATDPEFKERIDELRGKRLGCFCKPKACHGDVIVAYLENENEESDS